jgi:molybdate transport system substrate-binding protein
VVRVLCSNGIKPVVEELVPDFERNTGHKINITYGVSASLARQIEAGEAFDVAILTAALVDEAVEHLRIQRGSRTELARSPMALGIRQGRPKPAIASVDGLKRALRDAASIAYAREGASAPFFAQAPRASLGSLTKSRPRFA